MKNFKKDRVSLLKALRDLVTEDMDNASSINPNWDQDVANFIMEIKDKRRIRRLKLIRKELDKFIEETIINQKKLMELESGGYEEVPINGRKVLA